MAVSTKRPLPRLTSTAQVVEWGRRMVEELAWLRQEFGTAINAGGSGGAPTNATYVTLTTNATLTVERTLAVGAGLTKVDAGAGLTVTLDVAQPGLPAGSYGADPTQTLALDLNVYGQVTNYVPVPIAIDMAQVSQNTARILGRTTAGYGVTQELTVGTGLTLSAGSLSLTTPVALANGGTAANLSATGGASQVLRQSSAGAAITVSQLAHSDLSGSTSGDPHTQYALLAGRTGTTNNLTLSTDADGTLTGSGTAGFALKLAGGTPSAGGSAAIQFQPTAFNVGAGFVRLFDYAGTPTFNSASSILSAFTVAEHVDWPVTANLSSLTGSRAYVTAPRITNSPAGTIRALGGFWAIENAAEMYGQTAGVTGSSIMGLWNIPKASGTITVTDVWGLYDAPIANDAGSTITTRTAVAVASPTGSGTVTTNVGFDYLAQSKGTTKIAYRSQDTTATMRQYGPARFGDNTAPTNAVEIGGNGTLEFDIATNGIVIGSQTAAKGLTIKANSATAAAIPVEINNHVTTLGAGISSNIAINPTLTLDNGVAAIYGLEVGSRQGTRAAWTVNTAVTFFPSLLFAFLPNVANDSGNARTWAGPYGLAMQPKFTGDNATFTVTRTVGLGLGGDSTTPTSTATGASGKAVLTDYTTAYSYPYLQGGTAAANTVGVTRLTDVESVPTLNAPAAGGKVTVATRRGLWFRVATLAGAGAASLKEITDQAAVEVEDLSSASYTTTTLCSLRSAGASVQMRHAGSARFGANSAPVTTLDVRGGYSVGVTSKSANYTLTASDCVVLATAGAGGITLTLPSAANTGQVVKIIKVDTGAGAITIQRAGADVITRAAGVATVTSYTIAGGAGTQYAKKVLIADGTSTWHEFVNL